MNTVYMNVLIDTLVKKESILDQLIEHTTSQQKALEYKTPDVDLFEMKFSLKEKLIEQLNELDAGFETVFEHVKEEVKLHKDELKDEIKKMQELIARITQKSALLQVTEKRNQLSFQNYIMSEKNTIKSFNHSSKTITNYYKNMTNQYDGQSYFLDKKK